MKTREKLSKTTEIILNNTVDTEKEQPTIEIKKVGSKKFVFATYWHGVTPEMEKIIMERIPVLCVYAGVDMPCVFDSRQGGGMVKQFCFLWW